MADELWSRLQRPWLPYRTLMVTDEMPRREYRNFEPLDSMETWPYLPRRGRLRHGENTPLSRSVFIGMLVAETGNDGSLHGMDHQPGDKRRQ